ADPDRLTSNSRRPRSGGHRPRSPGARSARPQPPYFTHGRPKEQTMFRSACRSGSGFLAVVACLSLANAAPAQSVPYKEKSKGQIISDTGSRQDWVAVGQGTHVGKYTEAGHHDYAPDGSLSGEFTVTAADGSTISGTYDGSFAPIGGGFF